MTIKKIIACVIIIFMCISITSCHTSKKIVDRNYHNYENCDNTIMGFSLSKKDNKKLYLEASKWVGVPYRYGGNDFNGVDCSGLVKKIYESVYSKKTERNSAMIFEHNCKEINVKNLKEGDLLFFTTEKNSSRINHVGLFLKDRKFIHSTSSRGVIVSSLDDTYWNRVFYCAGKVIL